MSGTAPRKTVVLVDDSRYFRSMISYALDEDGHRVLAAASAAEALEILARELPDVDLVLLDLVMPDGNGIEALARIRALPGGALVPVVVLSQYALNALERGILEKHGVRAIVPKSAAVERLLGEARRALHPAESERRSASRAPVTIAVTVRARGATYLTSTFDVSERGLYLVLHDAEPPAPGSEVRLRFWVPGVEDLFDVGARVVWANAAGPSFRRTHPPGFGVEIVEPEAAVCGALRALLTGPPAA